MVGVCLTGGWTQAKAEGRSREEQKAEVKRKILDGIKIRTCRENTPHWRRVVAKEGVVLNLFWAMRQPDCERILDVPMLRSYLMSLVPYVQKLKNDEGETYTSDTIGIVILKNRHTRTLSHDQAEGFAVEDGFSSFSHMCEYFEEGIKNGTLYRVLEWG